MPVRPKHVPTRTCASCGSKSGKREMVRIVRLPEGRIEIDLTGRKPGRGTYLCRSVECWQQALRRDRLERVLKTKLGPEETEALRSFATQLELAEETT